MTDGQDLINEMKARQKLLASLPDKRTLEEKYSHAKKLFDCEQTLGFYRLAAALSSKSRNMDKKFLKAFRESMSCFDRSIDIMRKSGNERDELFGALVKYSVAAFTADFLRENFSESAHLSSECIEIARSISAQYDLKNNPKLPNVEMAVKKFENEKFSNLLRGSDVREGTSRIAKIPVNNVFYLEVKYSEKPKPEIVSEEIDSDASESELVYA